MQGHIYYFSLKFLSFFSNSLYIRLINTFTEAQSMEKSIRLYDELHEFARQPMTIDEANAEGCRFTETEATLKAFDDFKHDYLSFCEEQNAIEGEPFSQEPPSIDTYLKLHKATRKASRKLKIGLTTAPPVLDFSMREELAKPSVSKFLNTEATTTAAMKQLSLVQPTPKHANLKPASPVSFEKFVLNSSDKKFLDAVFFVPKECTKEMASTPEQFVKQHAFPNKGLVLNKMKLWIDKMASNPAEANKISITSMSGQKHFIGHIAFNFTSFRSFYNNKDEIPFVKLMGNSKIGQ